MSVQSRRTLLKRGVVLVGGAIGLGGGAAGARALTHEPAAAAPAKATPQRLELHGRNLLLQTPGRRPGERIEPGDLGTVTGDLVDGRGKPLGRFYATRSAFHSGVGGTLRADGSTELHTFQLPGGSILGLGSAVRGETIFAIVGGTGRYAAARGSYVAEQRLRELGGDGSTHFVLDIGA